MQMVFFNLWLDKEKWGKKVYTPQKPRRNEEAIGLVVFLFLWGLRPHVNIDFFTYTVTQYTPTPKFSLHPLDFIN